MALQHMLGTPSIQSTGMEPESDALNNTWMRKVLEAVVIRQTENSNLECGLNLNQVWSPLLD